MNDSLPTGLKTKEEQVIYHLLLFVAGQEPNSTLARQNLEAFCQAELKDRHQLQVVDVFKDHRLALEYKVLVTPCLVMLAPPPTVMVAGTLRDKEKMRIALRLPEE